MRSSQVIERGVPAASAAKAAIGRRTARAGFAAWLAFALVVLIAPRNGLGQLFEFPVSRLVPDGTGSGLVDPRILGEVETGASMTVGLTLSGVGPGGMLNGDLFATLAHENSLGIVDAFVVLLNRPGTRAGDDEGYRDNGLTVSFGSGAGLADIHNYRVTLGGNHSTPLGGPLTGVWSPDGRTTDPAGVLDTDPRTTSLNSFGSVDPHSGKWVLYVQDELSGGQARLDSWSLNFVGPVAAVPTAVWTGDGGDGLWNTAANWEDGVVPGPGDDVAIPPGRPGSPVTLNTDTSVRSVSSALAIFLGTYQLEVTGGFSELDGSVTCGPGARLTASGAGTVFRLTGATALDGAAFRARGGAILDLPNLASYRKPQCESIDWNVHGVGSRVVVPRLASVAGNAGCGLLSLIADAGATIDLRSVTNVPASLVGSTASGTGSLIDWRGLRSVERPDSFAVTESSGGVILLPPDSNAECFPESWIHGRKRAVKQAEIDGRIAGLPLGGTWITDWSWFDTSVFEVDAGGRFPDHPGAVRIHPFDLLTAARVERTVVVPNSGIAMLSFDVRAEDDCFLAVEVGDTRIWQSALRANWRHVDLDLRDWAGQTVTLRLRLTSGGLRSPWSSEHGWLDDAVVRVAAQAPAGLIASRTLPETQVCRWHEVWGISGNAETQANKGIQPVGRYLDGQSYVISTHPVDPSSAVILEKSQDIPAGSPVWRLKVRGVGDFAMRCLVDGTEIHSAVVSDEGGWRLFQLDLSPWAGTRRTLRIEHRSGGTSVGSSGNALWADLSVGPRLESQALVVGRHVFYNQSAFDGKSAAAEEADDQAIAPDKEALLEGVTPTFRNYTSYSRGLNGIMIDIAGLVGVPTSADFEFRAGLRGDPCGWNLAALPTGVAVRRGAGVWGSDRVTLVWDSVVAVRKQWLQVRVRSTSATGLAAEDVFFLGNAVGEVGNNGFPDPPLRPLANAMVNATDEVGIRGRSRSPLNPAAITDPYDINRDRSVNATDQVLSRANSTSPLTALPLVAMAGCSASLTGVSLASVDAGGSGKELGNLLSMSAGGVAVAVAPASSASSPSSGMSFEAAEPRLRMVRATDERLGIKIGATGRGNWVLETYEEDVGWIEVPVVMEIEADGGGVWWIDSRDWGGSRLFRVVSNAGP